MPGLLTRAFDKLLERSSNLTERLPFLGMRDGVVFLRGGGCEFGLELTLPSRVELAGERLGQMSEALRYVLSSGLPEGARLRVVCEFSPVRGVEKREQRHTSSSPLETLEQATQAHLEHLRTDGALSTLRFFLTVHCRTEKRPLELSYFEADLERYLELAQERRRRLVTLLGGCGFKAEAMTDQAVHSSIWRYLNPALASSKPPKYVSNFQTGKLKLGDLERGGDLQFATLRRQVLGSDLETSHLNYVGVGGHLVSSVLLTQFGESTQAGQLEGLLQTLAGSSFHIVLEATVVDQGKVRHKLGKDARGAILDNHDDSLGVPDAGNVAAEHKLNEALYALTAQGEKALSTSLAVVLSARDEETLERLREATLAELHRWEGASARSMSFQNAGIFLRLTPFNGKALEAGYRSLMFSQNVADLFPLLGPWPHSRGTLPLAAPPMPPTALENKFPFPLAPTPQPSSPLPSSPLLQMHTPHGTLAQLELSGDTPNLGMAVLGSSGSGKTFLTQSIVAAFARDADITVVDQKRDYQTLVNLLGGSTVALEPGGVSVNIFDLPEGEHEPDDAHRLFLRAMLRALSGEDSSGETRTFENALLEEAVTALYRVRALRGASSLTPMTDFVRTLGDLNDVGGHPLTGEMRKTAASLSFKLSSACGTSSIGRMLDAPSSVDLSHRILYFDASSLKEDPTLKRIGMLLVSYLLWKRTKTAPRDRLKLAVLEEFGVFAQLPEARDFAATLFKLGRAYRLHPLAVSQELEDLEAVRGILNNVSLYFLGQLSRGQAQGVCSLIGLDSSLSDTVSHLARGQYLTVRRTALGALEGEVLELLSSPLHYQTFTTTPQEVSAREASSAQSRSVKSTPLGP